MVSAILVSKGTPARRLIATGTPTSAPRAAPAAQPYPHRPTPRAGGHRTDPNEQNTQQSPCLGRIGAPQPGQSNTTTQASSGIVSAAACPQCGQVSTHTSPAAPSDIGPPHIDQRRTYQQPEQGQPA